MFHNVVYLAHAIAPPWFALYSKITGVEKGGPGGPGPPPNGRAKKELTLCLHLKDDISVTDILLSLIHI